MIRRMGASGAVEAGENVKRHPLLLYFGIGIFFYEEILTGKLDGDDE